MNKVVYIEAPQLEPISISVFIGTFNSMALHMISASSFA